MQPNNPTTPPPPLAAAADVALSARIAGIKARDAAWPHLLSIGQPDAIWDRRALLAAYDAQAAEVAGLRAERKERDQRMWRNGFEYAAAENDGRALVLADWVLWLTGRGEGRISPVAIEDVIGYAMALRGFTPDEDALAAPAAGKESDPA